MAGPGTLSPISGKRVSASCLDYVEHHGDARVPQSYAVDGFRLGDWVSTQRIQHSKGKLHADRQQRLETVNGWAWDPFADQWEEGFSRLLDYVEHHDHARIPRSCTVGAYRLGAWIDRQRASHSNGTLDGDRKQRLEDLPGWTWDPVADRWEEGFSRLLAYAESNGHARVPFSYIVDDYQLGAWVNSQRSVYLKGTLDADRQRRLQALPGWTWRPSADRWEEGYNRLLDYVKRRGDARVPISYAIDGFKLGTWVSTQRTNYTEGTLEVDHRRLLEALPGWTWRPKADQWEEGYKRLLDYVKRHGDACVAQSCIVDGFKLGTWVSTQRSNHAKCTLDPDRERRLQSLTGWTWKAR